MANIQIPEELFYQLIQYHLLDNPVAEDAIKKSLETKMDSMVMRDFYSKSKTAATPEEREKARLEYLDRKGITKDFRW